MTNRVHTKVRLVKCPRCSKILPEPEQVPLYACGGCGTVLKAKHYRDDKRPTGLDSREEVDAQSNDIIQARDGGESSSSSQRSSPANGNLSNGNEVKDQNASIDHNFEQIRGSFSADFTSSSNEHHLLEIEGNRETDRLSDHLNSEKHDVKEQPIAANSANEASFTEGTNVVENKEQFEEKYIARANSSKEASSTDESRLGSKDTLQMGPDHAVLKKMEVQQIVRVDGATDIEDDQCQHHRVIPSDKHKQIVDATCLRKNSALNLFSVIEGKDTVYDGSDQHISGENREEIPEDEPSSYEKITQEKTDGSDHDMKMIPNFVEDESNGNSRDDSVDCVDEQLGGMKLRDISSSTETSQGRDENSTAGTKSNLQTTRRDAGEISSSNVSPDPQCESNSLKNVTTTPRQEIKGFDVESKASENASKEDGRPLKVVPRSPTKDSLAYDGSVSSFDGNEDRVPEQQGHATEMSPKPKNVASKEGFHECKAKTSSQVLLDTKLKRSPFEEEVSVEENVFTMRNNRIRPNRDGFLPGVPLHRSSELGYESGSSFNYINDELPIHRMHNHRYNYRDLDPWVRKTYVEKRDFDRRRFPHEAICRENEFVPMYYNNYETSGEIYHRSSHHHGYLGRRRRGVENWSGTRSGSLTRVHYSGELFNERYQTRDPYMHQHPNDLRWSAQLPQPSSFCWDPYESCPTSPQRLMEPDMYPWAAHEVASVYEDQRRREYIMRRMQLREKKQQVVNRRSWPLAGGAPFVTCYFCLKVVQLPENLLLGRKTIIHRFKCGACSKVLEFSLENETCLAPYLRDGASVSAETDVGRSHSVEVGSRKSRNEEKTDGLHRAEAKAGGQSFRGRQMKVAWQLPSRRSKSPLHRLMGYSSPRKMLNGYAAEEDADW